MLNRSRENQPLRWYKDLKSYYYRPEWELYDLKYDPEELTNIVQNEKVIFNYITNFYEALALIKYYAIFFRVYLKS